MSGSFEEILGSLLAEADTVDEVELLPEPSSVNTTSLQQAQVGESDERRK